VDITPIAYSINSIFSQWHATLRRIRASQRDRISAAAFAGGSLAGRARVAAARVLAIAISHDYALDSQCA
jgi:hypothetical protein